jgi:Zn-dependent peptidase ImmA (M78 family)
MATKIIQQLRAVMPNRPLTRGESFRIAELQAAKLIKLQEIAAPYVPDSVVTSLPRVEVKRLSPFPASGASHWSKGRWQILINGSEAAVRNRFTLAHEAKHVLDHPFIKRLYPDTVGQKGYDRAEQVCDYFAACLLMPKPWVQAAYFDQGIQRLDLLARRFKVSQMAMRVRLLQLGIIDPQPRCLPYRREAVEAMFAIHPTEEGIAA